MSWHTRFKIYKWKKINKFIKLTANHHAASSSKVCNESIMTGNVPDIFKVRRITPILLKNGSAYQPEIYRPIAVMSSFSKIFEKLLHDQLISFLEKHNYSIRISIWF